MTDETIRAAYAAHAPPRAAHALAELGAAVAVAASGATVQTSDGCTLIDLASGGFGYGHPRVRALLVEQLSALPLSSRMFLSRPLSLLVKALAHLTPGPLEVTYPCNSSAEAVEGALKLARGYQRKRQRIVATFGAYHGATVGALSVCGMAALRGSAQQFPLHTTFMPYGDMTALSGAIDEQTAAVIIEPIATGCGLHIPPPGYLRALRARCTTTGALLIVDETNTGLGRTGELFAINAEQVAPDILVLGGALGGGMLPVAVYVATHHINYRVYGKRDPALHGSTTGGNPSACVAALAALDVLAEERVAARAVAAGELILATFAQYENRFGEHIGAYCGRGLLAGLRLRDVATARAVQRRALARGVLVRLDSDTAGAAWLGVRPPLIITSTELELGLRALELALADVLISSAARREYQYAARRNPQYL